MDINAAILALVRAISGSSEFAEYRNRRKAVMANQTLARSLTRLEAAEQRAFGENIPEPQKQQRLRELDSLYDELGRIPELASYFRAEENFRILFGRTIGSVDEGLTKVLDS